MENPPIKMDDLGIPLFSETSPWKPTAGTQKLVVWFDVSPLPKAVHFQLPAVSFPGLQRCFVPAIFERWKFEVPKKSLEIMHFYLETIGVQWETPHCCQKFHYAKLYRTSKNNKWQLFLAIFYINSHQQLWNIIETLRPRGIPNF